MLKGTIMDMTLFAVSLYLGSILSVVTFVFLLALRLENNSIMDIAYGPTYAIAALCLLFGTQQFTPLTVGVVGAIVLWALRLSVRIYRKNAGKPEDERYAAWRREWMEKGRTYFVLRSYLQVFLLQGTVIAIVGIPALLAIIHAETYALTGLIVGLFVFAFGLAYESVADWQLDRFIAKKRAGTIKDPLMRTGLFRYSRRPNYFGEATIWTGLAITVLSVPFGYLAVVSPLLITYIVTRVTGPMLEAIFLEKCPTEYRHYMHTTSYFVPWPPRPTE